MKQLKKKMLLWLALVMMLSLSLTTACKLPNGYNIITINDFGYTAESGILSLAPPGIVPEPPTFIEGTGYSEYIKTPHVLEGRVGYCLTCHDFGTQIPIPPSHFGRPQDTCTLCHLPAWEIIEQ